MSKSEDEREAIAQAHAILNRLSPAAERSEEIVASLRHATRLLTTAMALGLASEAALNNLRGDAANALSAVSGSLDAWALTQDTIETAKRTIAALLVGFDRQEGEPERLYADPLQPATLQRADEAIDYHTLEEAVLAWMRLPQHEREQATIRVNVAGGPIYTAAEIDRLYIAPRHGERH